MLNTAIGAAASAANAVGAGPVIADFKSCREKVVLRRKAVKYTWDRWFDAEIVASSVVGSHL